VRISYPLVPAPSATGPRLNLDSFARAARRHPDLVRRLVVLGLLEPERDRAGRLWFPPAQLVLAARIQRLRRGFALNYAAVGLVLDLLDRVADLERELRTTSPRPTEGRSWTSTA
jgi:pimeloyl-ACP methyl ester carboxylesterase